MMKCLENSSLSPCWQSHWPDFAYFLAEFWSTRPPSFENWKKNHIYISFRLKINSEGKNSNSHLKLEVILDAKTLLLENTPNISKLVLTPSKLKLSQYRNQTFITKRTPFD
jgi:hypothetical protein